MHGVGPEVSSVIDGTGTPIEKVSVWSLRSKVIPSTDSISKVISLVINENVVSATLTVAPPKAYVISDGVPCINF